jgi:hypothetical protein
MKNPERIKARYLKDPWPTRLAGLAADLGRVSSSARHATGGESVAQMLEESQYFIEWTAAELEPEIAAELVNIQVLIALWRRAWPEAQHNPRQRTILSAQAKQWADQILGFAGY